MFHNKYKSKVPKITRKFVRETKLDTNYIKEKVAQIVRYVSFELQLETDKNINIELNTLLQCNLNIK